MGTGSLQVGVAGLSHLGLVSATALASVGLHVVAFDPDAALVARLDDGDLPVLEPGLPELLSGPRRPAFTADVQALHGCAVVYLALDVATDDAGSSDLTPLQQLLDIVWPALGPAATVVVMSQVPPGFTRALSERRMAPAAPPAALYYQVETLIFGRAVERALRPERYIVGCADPAVPLPEPYRRVLAQFDCPVLPMRYESAELAKISINFMLVSSISTTNMLAEVCERVGADWREIAPALRLDARIGGKAYLEPGLGFGGGNLGRDLATVQLLSSRHGTDTRIIDAWRANSSYRRDWALRLLHAELFDRTAEPTLGIWGLAYKQDTASTRNSPAIALLEALGACGVSAYDPAASLPGALAAWVAPAADPLAACQGADALLVMTPWPEFSAVPLERVAAAMRGRLLIDPNRMLDAERAAALGFCHYSLGTSPRPSI